MALNFNFGNPNEAMSLSLQGLKDYYASIDDPNRKAAEIRKGYNNTLSTASSMQNTSNRQGAKIGISGAMNDKAGYRDTSFGRTQGDETKQLINMQQQKDDISARLRGIAMGQQLAGQQGDMALDDANYYQTEQERQAKKILDTQKYYQSLQDLMRERNNQAELLRLDQSYQPSGWDRFASIVVGKGSDAAGRGLANYWNELMTSSASDELDNLYNSLY